LAAYLSASGNPPVPSIQENAQSIQTYSVSYRSGEKHPHLERVAGQPDMLSDVLKPLAP
jgi:hypothetical protein